MASGEECQNADAASSVGQSDEDQSQDSDYEEITTTRSIPTKTGDDADAIEPHFDDERPGSSGTAFSAPLDNASDIDLLERCFVPYTMHPEQNQHSSGPVEEGWRAIRPEPVVKDTLAPLPYQKLCVGQPNLASASTLLHPNRPREFIKPSTSRRSPPTSPSPDEISGSVDTATKGDAQSLNVSESWSQSNSKIQSSVSEGGVLRRDDFQIGYQSHQHISALNPRPSEPARVSTQLASSADNGTQLRGPAVDSGVFHPPQHNQESRDTRAQQSSQPCVPQLHQPHIVEASNRATTIKQSQALPTTQTKADCPIDEMNLHTHSDPAVGQNKGQSAQHAARAECPTGSRQSRGRDRSQPKPRGQADVLHRVSGRHPNGRVAKPAPNSHFAEFNDFVQILRFKHQQWESAARNEYEEQIEAERSAKEDFEHALAQKTRDNEHLTGMVSEKDALISAFKRHLQKARRCVDGIGKDLVDTKKAIKDQQDRYSLMLAENKSSKDEIRNLATDITKFTEQDQRIKADSVKMARETVAQLETVTARQKRLEEQGLVKNQLIKEVRDRCSQLETAAESSEKYKETAVEKLQSHNEDVLAKLQEIHATIKDDQNSTTTGDALQKMHNIMLALHSKLPAKAEDVGSLRSMLEELGQSLREQMRSLKSVEPHPESASMTRHLDESVTALKETVQQSVQRVEESISGLTNVTKLQEKLSAAYERTSAVDSQLLDAQKIAEQLRSERSGLHDRLTTLQNDVSFERNATEQLDEMKATLTYKLQALEAAKQELGQKSANLSDMAAANATLRNDVQGLRARLKRLPDDTLDNASEDQRIEAEAQRRNEEYQRQMNAHMAKFQAEHKTRTENDMKRLTSENSKLKKEIESHVDNLSKYKNQLENQQRPTSNVSNQDEVCRLNDLLKAQQHDLTSLRRSLADAQTRNDQTTSLEEQCTLLSNQMEEQRREASELKEQNATLTKHIEDMRRNAEADGRSRETQHSLQGSLEQQEQALEAVRAELMRANEDLQRYKEEVERGKQSVEDAVKNARDEAEQQLAALQASLSNAQAELQIRKDDDESFRTQVEDSWSAEQQEFNVERAGLRLKVEEVVAEKDRVLNVLKRLSKRFEGNPVAAQIEHEIKSIGKQFDAESHEPAVNDGTPVANSRLTLPSGPKKKVPQDLPANHEAISSPTPGQSLVVPETVVEDSLRSFAEFNQSLVKSRDVEPRDDSSSLSMPFIRDSQPIRDAQKSLDREYGGVPAQRYRFGEAETGLTIRDQEPDRDFESNPGISKCFAPAIEEQHTGSLRGAAAPQGDQTTPQSRTRPNSSSKIVRRASERTSYPYLQANTADRRKPAFDVGEGDMIDGDDIEEFKSSQPMNNSSPNFLNNGVEINRKYSFGGESQRSRSFTGTNARATDPHLAARTTPTTIKRRSEDLAEENVEPKRNRREGSMARAVNINARLHGSQRGTERAPSKLFKASAVPRASVPIPSRTSSQARSRNRIRSQSRSGKRVTRRSSKQTEMEQRFAREINGG